MLFFVNRVKARQFAKTTGKKFVDQGATAAKRWAVRIL